jgi:hypothetical protein
MPRQNPLYNFLRSSVATNNPVLASHTVKLATTSAGEDFTLIELPRRQHVLVIAGKNYQIHNHHISIYANYKKASTQSDYHYTAEVIDEEGRDLKLHVYFDADDKVPKKPSLRFSDSSTSIKLKSTEAQLIIEIARMHSSTLMGQLKHEQMEHITGLENKLSRDMDHLFSLPQDDLESLDVCIESTDSLLNVARQLELMGGSRHPKKLLKQFRAGIEWAKTDMRLVNATPVSTSATTVLADRQTQHENKDGDISAEDAHAAEIPTPQLPPEDEIYLAECVKKTQTLRQQCSLKKVPTQHLSNYYLAAQEALIALLQCKNHALVNKHMRIVNKSLSVSKELCLTRLSLALANDDMDTAAELRDFVKFLPDTHIKLAIVKNKPERLGWLLANGGFAINRLQISHQDQQLSALEFAFEQNNIECFKLLLKHGATSMVTCKDGLPLAHHVLQKKRGEYYDALVNHIAGNKQFLFALANALEAHVLSTDLSDTMRDTLQTCIASYRESAGINLNISDKKSRMMARHGLELAKVATRNLSDQEIQAIHDAPAVTAKRKEYLNALKKYHTKLTPSQRRIHDMESDRLLKAMTKSLENDNSGKVSEVEVIAFYERQIELVNLLSRQHDVATEINKSRGKMYRTMPKHLKQLSVENEKLVREIDKLKITAEDFEKSDDTKSITLTVENIQKLRKLLAEAKSIKTSFEGLLSLIGIDTFNNAKDSNKMGHPTVPNSSSPFDSNSLATVKSFPFEDISASSTDITPTSTRSNSPARNSGPSSDFSADITPTSTRSNSPARNSGASSDFSADDSSPQTSRYTTQAQSISRDTSTSISPRGRFFSQKQAPETVIEHGPHCTC